MDHEKHRRVFYRFQDILHKLDLIDKGISIVPQALADYIIRYCPDSVCEESSSLYVDLIEADPEQLAAMHELEGMELSMSLLGTFRRLYL